MAYFYGPPCTWWEYVVRTLIIYQFKVIQNKNETSNKIVEGPAVDKRTPRPAIVIIREFIRVVSSSGGSFTFVLFGCKVFKSRKILRLLFGRSDRRLTIPQMSCWLQEVYSSRRRLQCRTTVTEADRECARDSGRPGQGVSWPSPHKIWSWGQKLHMALMSDRCQSNGN